MFLKSRHLLPEQMDDPHLDRARHFQALEGLARINRWTGNASLSYRPLRELAQTMGRDRLRVLDIGTGAGDVPIALCRQAARDGISLEIDACDVSPQAIDFAKQNLRRANVSVKLFPLDVLNEEIPGRYDAVMCSTFLHHFTDSQAVEILRKMRTAAELCVIVVDLVRSPLNWGQVWLATRILSRSQVVHSDGPQSIRAAFTLSEIQRLAEDAGLEDIRLHRSWPCRFVLVGRP